MEYRQLMQDRQQYELTPTILCPQLLDFNVLEHVREPVPCEKEVFMVSVDVSFVKEEELEILVTEDGMLKIILMHNFREAGNIRFARDCVYVYRIPEGVFWHQLVALWTKDNFLIIKQKEYDDSQLVATDEEKAKSTSPTKPSEFKKPGTITAASTSKPTTRKKTDSFTSPTDKAATAASTSKPTTRKKTDSFTSPTDKPNVDAASTSRRVTRARSDSLTPPTDKTTSVVAPASKPATRKKTETPRTDKTTTASKKANLVSPADKSTTAADASISKSAASKKTDDLESPTNKSVDASTSKSAVSKEAAALSSPTGESAAILTPEADASKETNAGQQNQFPFNLKPEKTEKIFKPILSVVELKRFMSDIEERMLCVKRFIDNHSFANPDEQTNDSKRLPSEK